MPTWLLVGYLLLVPSFSQTKSCTGPERNDIQAVLNAVNWKTLADQLNLHDQVADIQDICNREIDIRPCYFREVLSRYIQSQPEESCDNTRREITMALEQLGYVNEASRVRGGLIVESPPSALLNHSDNVLNSSSVIPPESYGSGSVFRPQEIRERAAHLQDMFVTVVMHTKICFKKKEKESVEFLIEFQSMLEDLPLSNMHKHLHFLKEEKDRINMANNVREILDILWPYWNYRDYAFLERIIEEFGTSKLKKEMKDYISELEDFEKKTSVEDYNSAAQDEVEIPAHFKELAITQLNDPAQYSLYDVRMLIKEIVNLSTLTGYSVLVKSLSPSSVKIVLAFPPEAYEELLRVLDEKFMKIHQLEWPKEETSQQKGTETSDSRGEISSESPTVEPITEPSSPSSGPTQPASSTENGIIYWLLSAVIIASFTCIFIIIIRTSPAQQKQHNESQSQPESEATSSLTPSSQLTGSSTSSSVPTSDCSSHEVGGSSSDRARIQAVVEAAAQLQDRFATVIKHTKICFMEEAKSTEFLKKFAITLTNIPLSMRHKHLHFLKEKERITKADVESFLDILDPHLDYREYAFLEQIIMEFGPSELRQEMKEYIVELENFEKKTSIIDYKSAAPDTIPIPANFKAIMHLKDPAQCLLYEIRQLKNEIDELTGYTCSTWLESVSRDSNKVVLAFPPEAYERLSLVLDEQFMKKHQLEWIKEETLQQKETKTSIHDSPLMSGALSQEKEYEYLTEEEEYLCPICFGVVQNPYQLLCCGYNYCHDCIMRLPIEESPCPQQPSHESRSIRKCPTCRGKFCENCMERNACLYNDLRELKVKCRYHNDYCKWKGRQLNSGEHEREECRFVLNQKPTEERRDVVPVKRILHNFSDIKKDHMLEVPFYTHDGGYKMHLWVFPNGYGKEEGKYMSVFTCLVKGENDDKLKWPLCGSITVQLLDQSGKGNHLERKIHYTNRYNNTYRGRVTHSARSEGVRPDKPFLASEALFDKSCDYLRNDCLKFRISECKVQTSWRKIMGIVAFIVVVFLIFIFSYFTK